MPSTIYSTGSYADTMSVTPTPPPRPALAKAPDAALHPVSGKPVPSSRRKPGKGATSDSLRGPAKDKLVDLGVRVPKSVRKKVRSQAKADGIAPDEVVARILDTHLP